MSYYVHGSKIMNDSNTGLASGNRNGIPENGETIELIPGVVNSSGCEGRINCLESGVLKNHSG